MVKDDYRVERNHPFLFDYCLLIVNTEIRINFEPTGIKVPLYAHSPTQLPDHSKTAQISFSVECKIASFLHRASGFLLDTPQSYLLIF